MLECPEVGGDTVFVNTAEAYKKLSPSFAERLHGLRAEHKAKTGLTSIHPVVRTHPVTGEKCLFVNPLCPYLSIAFLLDVRSLVVDTTQIVGFKKEESDSLLRFLFEHLAYSQDCQARVQWTEDTVVIFDVSLFFPFNRLFTWKCLLNANSPLYRIEPPCIQPSSTLSMYVHHQSTYFLPSSHLLHISSTSPPHTALTSTFRTNAAISHACRQQRRNPTRHPFTRGWRIDDDLVRSVAHAWICFMGSSTKPFLYSMHQCHSMPNKSPTSPPLLRMPIAGLLFTTLSPGYAHMD